MERINPFSDYGFKLIFGQEKTKPLLISFLNSLLEGEKEIVDLTYQNLEQLPGTVDGRRSIYDVYCTTSDGKHIIVEMQYKAQDNFKERSLYYLSLAIGNQGKRGKDWQFEMDAVYGVFFMNFRLNETSKFCTDVILADRETGELFSDKLRQIFLELPQFTKSESECTTNFDRWIYTLKHMENLKTIPFQPYMADFKLLEEITDLASLSKEDRERYDESLKVYRDNMAVLAFAKKEGIEIGIEIGIEKGIEKGMETMARKLKLRGMDTSSIAEITGLNLDQINAL